MADPNPFGGGGVDANGIIIRDESGEIVDNVPADSIKNYQSGQTVYSYTDDKGTTKYTNSVYDLPASIKLNTKTGDIHIDAPKVVLDMPEFNTAFPTDVLEKYSQAYKLNKNYKVPYTEYDDDGSEKSTTEISIPEMIEKINESLNKENGFMDSVRKSERQREKDRDVYGNKVNNWSLTQLQRTLDFGGKAIYIPKLLLNNSMKSLNDLVDENGLIKVEDFRDAYYNRDKIGRQELTEVVGQLETMLKYGNYGDEKFENGDENLMSADETSKALNLKNFLLSNDPDAEWYQQVGDNIASFTNNALYGCNRVFFNLANVGEAIVTGGQGHGAQDYIKEMDQSYKEWNEEMTLVNDATATLSWLGQIGGAIGGTILTHKLFGAVANDVGSSLGTRASAYAAEVETIANMGPSAQAALTVETMSSIVSNVENISAGARIMLKMASAAEKASYAYGIYQSFKKAHVAGGFAVEFLLDTVHDALLYDSTSLREALEASDQETRDYWLGQLADNGKWWIGMSSAKLLLKGAGKTNLGKTLNAYATKYINKLAANVGDKKAAIKDHVAGGDLIKKLEDKLEATKSQNKKRRIANKIEQTRWNEVLREARRELGNIELDKKSLISLTDDSTKNFVKSVNAVKAIENAIDNYNRNIYFKRQEMLGLQKDPSTGEQIFINASLGGSNMRASNFYLKLSDFGAKYNLKAAPQSMISQEMIDYMMGSYHSNILQAFVDSNGPNAAKAADALSIVKQNLEIAKASLPEEIRLFIDQNRGVYTDFYRSLNEYGKAKGLVDRDKITSYENNPIWAENGYMPIKVAKDKTGGQWISEDGTVHAVLEQDFNEHKFLESAGQHYVDPELVRQTRISNMARAENNLSIMKAYNQLESATNIVRVSGEDSAYAKAVEKGRHSLENAINSASENFGETAMFDINRASGKKASVKKNATYTMASKTDAVAQFSYSDTKRVLIKNGVIDENRPYLTSDVTLEGYRDWFDSQSDAVKNYLKQEYGRYGTDGFDGLLTAIETGGDDFEAGLQRAYLLGDEAFMSSDVLKAAIDNQRAGKTAFYDGVVNRSAAKKLLSIETINADEVSATLSNAIQRDVEGYVNAVLGDTGARKTIDAMAKTANGSPSNARYYALKQLQNNPKAALDSLDKFMDDAVKGQNIGSDDLIKIKNAAHDMFDDIVRNEVSDAANSLRTINSSLLSNEDIFEKVNKINTEIRAAEKEINSRDTNLVMYLDEQGREVYAETDPTFASLFNYRYRMDRGEASALAKANAAMSKLFRYGTTSVNLSSFGNQLFRDTGNAVMVGGAWQTIKTNADNLKDVFGENIVEQIKRFDPTGYEIKQIEAVAEATGQSVKEAAVSRELARGAAISPSTTERTLYKDFMRDAYASDKDMLIGQMRTKLQQVVDKYNPEELLNGRRENYLRNRVYASAYNDAFTNGYTIEQARTFAEFAMSNATTNFSRQLYHMQAISDSTPYFRAAINGTKSFWRMWSLDPVGISGRIMGGLILPTIYLVGASLADTESREIYKQIPEYQKTNSLVFVVNGSVMSVPIPQELGNIVAPFRQFTEYLWNANKNDFWELMMNDTLGYFPTDLTGFTTIDMNTMINEPTLGDRLARGFSKLFSQMAPVPLKSAYMLAFKIDPYTGKNISDPSYSYWDDEAGNVVTMDYNQNEFAKVFSSWFGGNLGMTPALAEKLLSGIFGTTGANLLSDVTALCNGGWEKAAEETMTNIGTQLGKPFSVNVYDQADSAWKLSVRQLTAEKNVITSSEEWKVINQKLSQEKDPEKRKELLAKRRDLMNDYQQRVVETVKRLQSKYGGTYDHNKFAATVQLLNFASDPAYQSGSQYSSDVASENYWNGRDDAIHTMQQLGITGTSDMSIFGYLALDKNNNPIVKYSSPVAIIDIENSWQNAKDIHAANIKAAVSAAELWDKKDAVDRQVEAIYAKGKLKNSDYNAINSIYVNWNAEVMKTVAPYVDQMTPEAAINNTEVLNYLKGLIEVPGDFKKDRYGRYVTNKKLGEGSATDAYARNYIKKIFKVNDTAYTGGHNYSGRKSLGGK